MTTTKTTPKKRGRPAKNTGPKLPAKPKATPRPKTTVKKTPAAPATDSLPIKPFVFEILDLASAQKSNAKKVEVLKNYEHD